MKKLIGILSIIMLLSCCDESKRNISVKEVNQAFYDKMVENTYTVIFDGCQYVIFNHGRRGYMSHKGNCNNIIHKR